MRRDSLQLVQNCNRIQVKVVWRSHRLTHRPTNPYSSCSWKREMVELRQHSATMDYLRFSGEGMKSNPMTFAGVGV